MRQAILLSLLLCVAASSYTQTNNGARIFGEDIFSTWVDEFGGPTITPDGKTLFFSMSIPRSYFYAICTSHLKDGKWTNPEIAEFSGRNWDFDPVLSPDGKKLYFGTDRTSEGGSKSDFDIWFVEKTSNGWSHPKSAGSAVNSKYNEVFASATADGTLYFASAQPDAKGGIDIYRSRLVNGEYSKAERLPDTINTEAAEFEPFIAPDESFMLVGAFNHPETAGGSDIYIAFNTNGQWTPLKNLGSSVNTPAREYSPRISPDGKYLFFASERGFLTTPQEKQASYQDFKDMRKHIQNGWGNLYQIDLEPLKQAALKSLEKP